MTSSSPSPPEEKFRLTFPKQAIPSTKPTGEMSKPLEEKSWFRLLKAWYFGVYLAALASVVLIAFSAWPEQFVSDWESSIVCSNGNIYEAGPNSIHATNGRLNSENDTKARKLCAFNIKPDVENRFTTPKEINYSIAASVKTRGSYKRVLSALLWGLLIVGLLGEVVRRAFFYAAIGRPFFSDIGNLAGRVGLVGSFFTRPEEQPTPDTRTDSAGTIGSFCRNCGNDLSPDPGKYCSNCGAETQIDDRANTSIAWTNICVVCWAITWRTLLISVPCGLALGAIGALVAFFFDSEPGTGAKYAGMLGSLAGIPAFFLTLKWLLNKRIGNFTLHVKFHSPGGRA